MSEQNQTPEWGPEDSEVISAELRRVTLGGKPERPELYVGFAKHLHEMNVAASRAIAAFMRAFRV